MNCVQIMGRLTDNPIYEEKNDLNVARYILAINEGKDKDANFIPCTAYGNNAVITNQYLKKGQLVVVTGKLHSYIDKNSNHKINVIVSKQYFFGDILGLPTTPKDHYLDFDKIDESELPFH